MIVLFVIDVETQDSLIELFNEREVLRVQNRASMECSRHQPRPSSKVLSLRTNAPSSLPVSKLAEVWLMVRDNATLCLGLM